MSGTVTLELFSRDSRPNCPLLVAYVSIGFALIHRALHDREPLEQGSAGPGPHSVANSMLVTVPSFASGGTCPTESLDYGVHTRAMCLSPHDPDQLGPGHVRSLTQSGGENAQMPI